jgi:hypothetical protein
MASRTLGKSRTAAQPLHRARSWWLESSYNPRPWGSRQTLISRICSAQSTTAEEFRSACRQYVSEHGQFRSWSRYEAPADIFWDDQKYRGEAYAAFAWAVYIAEVTVDLTTYSVPRWMTSSRFRKWAEFFIHGSRDRDKSSVALPKRIGFSLYEKVVWQNGRMQNGQMTNYIMPTSADLPPIRVFFEELGNVYGAYGAKGIGELPHGWPGSGDRQCGSKTRSEFVLILFLCFRRTLWMRSRLRYSLSSASSSQAREPMTHSAAQSRQMLKFHSR